MTMTTRQRALFRAAVTTAGLTAPANAVSNTDAELIEACNRVMAIEAKKAAIYAGLRTTMEDRRMQPTIDALSAEARAAMWGVYDAPETETLAGLEAMARLAQVLAPKDADGSLSAPAGDAEWLAFEVTRYLTEGAAT